MEARPTPCTNYVQINGAGITNTIVRAELAAIAATILQDHSHIASDSLLHSTKSESKHCIQSFTIIMLVLPCFSQSELRGGWVI
eukprot:582608-Pelagomonas_calceolata.AAC.1